MEGLWEAMKQGELVLLQWIIKATTKADSVRYVVEKLYRMEKL